MMSRVAKVREGLAQAHGLLDAARAPLEDIVVDFQQVFDGFELQGVCFWRQHGKVNVLGTVQSRSGDECVCQYYGGGIEHLHTNQVFSLVMGSIKLDTQYLLRGSKEVFVADDVDRDLLEAECVASWNGNTAGNETISFAHITAKDDKLQRIPPEFICPLSLSVFRNPMTTSWGGSCESSHLRRFLARRGIDPHTRKELDSETIIPNWTL